MRTTWRDLRHTWTGLDFIRARLRRWRVPRTFKTSPPPHLAELRHQALELAIMRARAAREALARVAQPADRRLLDARSVLVLEHKAGESRDAINVDGTRPGLEAPTP